MGNMENNTEYLSNKKSKIVFIMGCTATRKSKLSINLGNFFRLEIINSNKIQFYKGLDIITNKIAYTDRDLTVEEFCGLIEESIVEVIKRGRLPIIVGGLNNYIEELVENRVRDFRSRFDCCFVWIDVSLPILYRYISKRVDQMVEAAMVDEVREIFFSHADYSRGIRRAIGVPELDSYFKAEKNNKKMLQ